MAIGVSLLGLAIFNLVLVWSLASDLLWRQLFAWGVGGVAFFVGRYLVFKKPKGWFYGLLWGGLVVFLLLPFVLGQIKRGSVRWINIGSFSLQPSELGKPLFVWSLAGLCEYYPPSTLFGFLVNLALIVMTVTCIFLEPDLGMAFLFAWAGIWILAAAKARWWYLVGLMGGGIIVGIFGYHFFLSPYQKARLLAFVYPQKDPLGIAYHGIQAQLAIGSGGLLGKGLRLGEQTQLAFLPERHTDFIFASLCEELGFIGGSLLLLLYGLFFVALWKKVEMSQSEITKKIRVGVFAFLWGQTLINLGMNLGLLPITGLPLPFVSYGGSSLVASFLLLGLAL